MNGRQHLVLKCSQQDVERVVQTAMAAGAYTEKTFQPTTGTATAQRRKTHTDLAGSYSTEELLHFSWQPRGHEYWLEWWVEEPRTRALLPRSAAAVGRQVAAALETLQHTRQLRTEATRHPVVGPGQARPAPWVGTMRDYSACATVEQAQPLTAGIFPLGRWAYEDQRGPQLYLGHDPTSGNPIEFQGTLVCGPSGSGKTELLLRWVMAALAARHNVFVIDVKGTMRAKLEERYRQAGQKPPWQQPKARVTLRSISLDSRARTDRFNLLAEAGVSSPDDVRRIRNIAEVLLPSEGLQTGEQGVYRTNRVTWLAAIIGLLRLHDFYDPLPDGAARDLADVYEILASEDVLVDDHLKPIAELESDRLANGEPLAFLDLSHWAKQLEGIVLADEKGIVRDHDDVVVMVGKRPPGGKDSYWSFTANILGPLTGFQGKGPLHRVTAGGDPEAGDPTASTWGRRFRLQELAGQHQTLMILGLNTTSTEDADALMRVVVRYIDGLIRERYRSSDDGRDILLVLDEVARIDGFKVGEYLNVAREARASAVVVYQELEQLAEREGGKSGVKKVLGTVGTQIYLRGARTGTVEHLLEGNVFGTRRVDHWSETTAAGREPEYQRHSVEESGLSATALESLPAGPYAALVVGGGMPLGCPVLVDLADESVNTHRHR
jgi:hypothetical protein